MRPASGRVTEVLMKHDGQWLLIGDHGGPERGEKPWLRRRSWGGLREVWDIGAVPAHQTFRERHTKSTQTEAAAPTSWSRRVQAAEPAREPRRSTEPIAWGWQHVRPPNIVRTAQGHPWNSIGVVEH